MPFELSRRMWEAADAIRSRLTEKARELRRRAEAEAGRVFRDVSDRLLAAPRHEECHSPGCHYHGRPTNPEVNVVIGPCTGALVETMAEVMTLAGYREIRADLPNREMPELVRGTVRSHRPSLAALGGGRPVLMDVFVPGETAPEEQLSRWQLFSSAADQVAGEFHVVVPSSVEGLAGGEWVRRLSDSVGISVTKVWEV
jgi:hypothetical protein